MKIVKIEVLAKERATKHSWIQRLAIKHLKIIPLIQYNVSFVVVLEKDKSLQVGSTILLEDTFLHVSNEYDCGGYKNYALIPCKHITTYQIHHILIKKEIYYSPDKNFKRQNYEHR